jgi:protein subunit release factor A
MLDRLQSLADRYEELTAEMGRPEVASDHERLQELAKERASLEEIVPFLNAALAPPER